MSSSDLLAKYKASNEAIFLSQDIKSVSSHFSKYYADTLQADVQGGLKNADEFLQSLIEMRTFLSDVKIEYVKQIVSGRNVGSYEKLTAKKPDGSKASGSAIIFATFGEEGSADEDKIVAFRECLELD
ncbi:unnamed protein product [Tilletia controversa]|uniref:Uncharacterized protein n=3 Tax=Tilletia TaxID=13289 RepID=A0A8X7MZF7_9BASI|nr:hypothetical protein CF336_g847 [Tilletia laevis]KAE8204326.1 hypothetical protein CF328_g1145 [Tilletia controversa]KAE8265346.1 hypothetical protein A4X03_0g322 [Tilletia caries]KAE8208033.1 hypothetical protein CF335_g711 [Tilletia laevis]KAE8254461.1 hypothetical protein A4X06_0g888 [Tilletia controversa]